MEKHYTELTIAGYPVAATIEFERIEYITGYDSPCSSFHVDRIVIPTYDEFMKNEDNTEEMYQEILAGREKAKEKALLVLEEECDLDVMSVGRIGSLFF